MCALEQTNRQSGYMLIKQNKLRLCVLASFVPDIPAPRNIPLLQDFLVLHRSQLIERCRITSSARRSPKATDTELDKGIPLFLDQLITTLSHEPRQPPSLTPQAASEGARGGESPEMITSALLHGRALLGAGFTVEQVVHSYGDMCQAITGLAFEKELSIPTDEFKTLNRCLDNVMAAAVKQYSSERDASLKIGPQPLNEQLGALAHELRNILHTATLAFTAIKKGNVGNSGATSALLDRCLIGLRTLIDRSLADVRVSAGMPPGLTLTNLAEFVGKVRISAALEAHEKHCELKVAGVDPSLAVFVDEDLLMSAVGNLLQNAFKFTQHGSEVCLHAHALAGRVLIEISDNCGGLAPGAAEKMFAPFTRLGNDTSGLGLGLSIARRSIEANHGALTVRDVPGFGCVFIIDLPRHAMPVFAHPSVN